MKYCLILNFIFCISIIWWSFSWNIVEISQFLIYCLNKLQKNILPAKKNFFIIHKQLNGLILKSLKRSGLKMKNKLVRPGQNFVFWFKLGWNFNFLLGWGEPGWNFYLYFGPGQAEIETFAVWVRAWKSGPCRLLIQCNMTAKVFLRFKQH